MAREPEQYDIIVIGGGPVGLSAAQAATAQGRKSLIIDNTPRSLVQFTGPTGIFSKALRDTAKKVDVMTLRGMGLRDGVVWRQIQDMTFDVLRTNGLNNLKEMQTKHIPHLRGNASFVDSNTLSIHQSGSQSVEVKGKTILIATGSTAYRLPSIPYDETRVFDSDTIKGLSFLPKSVTIIGAGIIAVEYARIFTKLQCRVTMIVRQRSLDVAFKRIGIDSGIAVQLQKDLNLNKVRIVFNAQVSAVEKPDLQLEDSSRRQPLTLTLTTPDGQPHPVNQISTEVTMLTALCHISDVFK
jgi:NAD(P) transhydrogenase